MTKVVDGVHVLDFEQWKNLPDVQEMVNDLDSCETCDGSGKHVCECGDDHECGDCAGGGLALGTIREIYNKQLKAELEKLLIWKEKALAGKAGVQ